MLVVFLSSCALAPRPTPEAIAAQQRILQQQAGMQLKQIQQYAIDHPDTRTPQQREADSINLSIKLAAEQAHADAVRAQQQQQQQGQAWCIYSPSGGVVGLMPCQ